MKYALNVIMNRGGVSRRHKARGQSHGQGHKKKSEAKDRNARGQGPRTQMQVLS